MQILNTYVVSKPSTLMLFIYLMSIFGILFGTISVAICYSEGYNKMAVFLSVIVIISLIVFILCLSNSFPVPLQKETTHYEILLDDDYPVSSLLEKYDITESKGQLLDCIDKE